MNRKENNMNQTRRRFFQGAAAAGLAAAGWTSSAHAKVAPVTMKERSFEPMPWCNISTVKQGGEVIKRVNRPNSGILVDPIHFYRADNKYEDIDNLPQGTLRYCQICDITADKPKTMDGILYQARNYRLSPGTGAADLQLLKHLPNLPISIEVCNADLALTMSPLERARMYLEDMGAVLNKAGEC